MRTGSIARRLAILCLVVLGVTPGAAHAAEVRLIAANAVKDSVREVVSAFERASGHTVVTAWSGTEAIAKRIRDGEVFDLVLIAAPNIDQLIAEGKLATGSRTDYAKSGVGVAVRRGLPKPDISTGDAIKKAVLAASSVAYSSGPSGFYLAELFQKMGIAEQIKAKVKQPPSGAQVGDLIARGEADLGFQQVSELLHFQGIDYLGPLPPDIQNITTYSIGLHASAQTLEAAKALVEALRSPEARSLITKAGMDPA
jgi:molybdate transport system substrate-binding protein